MTRQNLYRWTTLVVAFYLLVLLGAVAVRRYFPDMPDHPPSPVYTTYKDLLPLAIAIPAAWLGYCFQRRMSYLAALRALWGELIPAVQQAVQYTHVAAPEAPQFAKTLGDLATATDSLRGVFRNVDGLYPFENLKDITAVISWLGCHSQRSADERKAARDCVVELWKTMHQALLAEFDRELPVRPLLLNSGVEPLKKRLAAGSSAMQTLKAETARQKEAWRRDSGRFD